MGERIKNRPDPTEEEPIGKRKKVEEEKRKKKITPGDESPDNISTTEQVERKQPGDKRIFSKEGVEVDASSLGPKEIADLKKNGYKEKSAVEEPKPDRKPEKSIGTKKAVKSQKAETITKASPAEEKKEQKTETKEKIELHAPKKEDISFYKERIRIGKEKIEYLRRRLAAVKKPDAGIEKRLHMEEAAVKTIEAKLKIAEAGVETIKKKIEQKFSSQEWGKKRPKNEEFKKAESMLARRYLEKGLAEDEINEMRRSMGWRKEVNDFLAAEKRTQEPTLAEQKTEKTNKLKEIKEQLKATYGEALDGKHRNQFEEFKESIGDVPGKKYNHEAIRDSYLAKLGWKVKYDAFNSKAWLVDGDKNFIDKNGAATKNKKEKIEFKTQWRFPTETPFIKFLMAQVEKKLGGTQSPVEAKASPEENIKQWKEHFGPLAEVQEEIEKAEKEAGSDKRTEEQKKEDYKKWKEYHASSGMAEVQEEIERSQTKKPKSFWQRLKSFFSREKKF
ncbi:MAG: hypothetical protein ISS83_01305 [Candidatus Pacebacteria bacterium]|nr:hypothetical protein [Candidatus Paceibacterota bacterium]